MGLIVQAANNIAGNISAINRAKENSSLPAGFDEATNFTNTTLLDGHDVFLMPTHFDDIKADYLREQAADKKARFYKVTKLVIIVAFLVIAGIAITLTSLFAPLYAPVVALATPILGHQAYVHLYKPRNEKQKQYEQAAQQARNARKVIEKSFTLPAGEFATAYKTATGQDLPTHLGNEKACHQMLTLISKGLQAQPTDVRSDVILTPMRYAHGMYTFFHEEMKKLGQEIYPSNVANPSDLDTSIHSCKEIDDLCNEIKNQFPGTLVAQISSDAQQNMSKKQSKVLEARIKKYEAKLSESLTKPEEFLESEKTRLFEEFKQANKSEEKLEIIRKLSIVLRNFETLKREREEAQYGIYQTYLRNKVCAAYWLHILRYPFNLIPTVDRSFFNDHSPTSRLATYDLTRIRPSEDDSSKDNSNAFTQFFAKGSPLNADREFIAAASVNEVSKIFFTQPKDQETIINTVRARLKLPPPSTLKRSRSWG